MSRVHDALRRAEQAAPTIDVAGETVVTNGMTNGTTAAVVEYAGGGAVITDLGFPRDLLSRIKEIPFTPSVDSHLIDMSKPHEAPSEEFRTLRTRLNHLQSLQPISTLVVTSPSPAEGKSFAAVNLALAEAQLANNPTLLIDCDSGDRLRIACSKSIVHLG